MKTVKYITIAVAIIAASCTNQLGEQIPAGQEIIITASFNNSEQTKTTLQDGGSSVFWEQGDEIKLFYDGTGSRFTSSINELSRVAKFAGTLNVAIGFDEGFSTDVPIIGLYPYRADATADNTSITTTLPEEQIGKAGSFGKGMNISVGHSQSLAMGFYNLCGGVRFSLTQEGIQEVIFEGQNSEDIAGKVKVNVSDVVPTVSEVIEGQKVITLKAPNGGTFEISKWYYIVVLPGTLSNGFKMTFNKETQTAVLKSSSSVTIKRGTFGSLADADESLIFKDKGSDPQGDNIVFKDPAAKFACVAKFDTNGDGEVSIDEAEAATSFSGLFTDWKTVASFDEIKYFKNVHSINGLFKDCDKLETISIPENITDLGTSAFSGCASLTSVVLPSNIASIGSNSFMECSKLPSIDIPSKVTSIGDAAFYDCSSMTRIDLPSSITSIGNHSFCNCSNLRTINLPASLKTIGQLAFYECSSLTQVTIPEGVTLIPSSCFFGCSSLTSVSIPEGVTSIDDGAFSGVMMWNLKLPTSIKSLGNCFGSITCVIVPSSSPVSIRSNTFSEVTAIFVPSNLIEMYKVMTNWATYSSKLHPLGMYKEKNEFVLATSGAVDMGTSVKWAACNLGASKPEEYGGYYQWAGTQDVTDTSIYLDWDNCPYHTGSNEYSGWTKYIPSDISSYWSGTGNPDNKTILGPEDDAAHAQLGGKWRMPTGEEFEELTGSCLWEWISYNGVSGRMVYSFETGNIIFFPAAGCRDNSDFRYVGSYGYYWSSSLGTDYPLSAYSINFSSFYVEAHSYCRFYGLSVRPVSE